MHPTTDLSFVANLASIASLYFCLPVGAAGWIWLVLMGAGVRRVIAIVAVALLAAIYLGDVGTHRGWFGPQTQVASKSSAANMRSDDRALPANKKNEFISALGQFSSQKTYHSKRVVFFCLPDDQTSCRIAHSYFNIIRFAPGWSTAWGGPIPYDPTGPAMYGINILTMSADMVDLNPNAETGSPYGLWKELDAMNIACGGWYIWPSLFKDLDGFAFVVGRAWPRDKCPRGE
jgi:hypothetical protein